MAFSVAEGQRIPPSLRNIYKELEADLGVPIPSSGDLSAWTKQGILLLNTVLTVEQGIANSHKDWGWQKFTHAVFQACIDLPQPIVFILWGNSAKNFVSDLQLDRLWEKHKACVWSTHPSPLGATRATQTAPAFIGSRPFSKTNLLLSQMGAEPINWRLPE